LFSTGGGGGRNSAYLAPVKWPNCFFDGMWVREAKVKSEVTQRSLVLSRFGQLCGCAHDLSTYFCVGFCRSILQCYVFKRPSRRPQGHFLTFILALGP